MSIFFRNKIKKRFMRFRGWEKISQKDLNLYFFSASQRSGKKGLIICSFPLENCISCDFIKKQRDYVLV